MGMFDDVHMDYEVPGIPELPRDFQTKSLGSMLDRYTITKAGRLIRTSPGFSLKPVEAPADSATGKPDVDIDFHGDMLLLASEGGFQEFVARFTHGNLEWLRPIADLPPELLTRLY